MKIFFTSQAKAQKAYTSYEDLLPDPSPKKCGLYVRCGKTLQQHGIIWRSKKAISALARMALSIFVVPLLIPQYRKAVAKRFSQSYSGQEKLSLYILSTSIATNNSSIASNNKTSIAIPTRIQDEKHLKVKNRAPAYNSDSVADASIVPVNNQITANIPKFTAQKLSQEFPNPCGDKNKQGELAERFSHLDSHGIAALIESGDLNSSSYKYIFELLSKEHLKALKNVTAMTLLFLLPNPDGDVDKELFVVERLRYLPVELISHLIESGDLNSSSYKHILGALTEKHLKALKKVTPITLLFLLPNPGDDKNKKDLIAKRMSYLPIEPITLLIEKGSLNSRDYKHILAALTEKHLKALKNVTATTLLSLLPNPVDDKDEKALVAERLSFLPIDLITSFIEKGSLNSRDYKHIFAALTEKHLAALKKMTATTLSFLLPDSAMATQHLRHLPVELIALLIEKESLNSSSYKHILAALAEKHLKTLKKVTANTLLSLLPDSAMATQHLRHLPIELITPLIEKESLNSSSYKHILAALNEKHLAALKNVTATTLLSLLPNPGDDKDKKALVAERLSFLPIELITPSIEKESLNSSSYKHILAALAEKHLKTLKKVTANTLLSLLPDSAMATQHLRHLPVDLITPLIEKENLNSSSYKHILATLTEKHFKALKTLTKTTLEFLLPNPDGDIEKEFFIAERLHFLSEKLIHSLIAKAFFSNYLAMLLNEKLLHEINFSAISQEALHQLFPVYDFDSLKKEYSIFIRDSEGRPVARSAMASDEDLLELARANEEKVEKLLSRLHPKQISVVKRRLDEKEEDSYKDLPYATDSNTATAKEVNSTYKKLAKKFHPDRIKQQQGETDEKFEIRKEVWADEFKKITAAHDILTGKVVTPGIP